jgi:methylenetetrahydrofolate--tRNA-(uracil-5-)-methyltransferase
MDNDIVHIIGGGLAGSEAAWQLINNNIKVILHEMRPIVETPAHKTSQLAELVCSNSFRSDDKEYNAVGVLHEELRIADSLIMKIADLNKIPAGSALAVDRDNFARDVNEAITNNKNITIIPIIETRKNLFNCREFFLPIEKVNSACPQNETIINRA